MNRTEVKIEWWRQTLIWAWKTLRVLLIVSLVLVLLGFLLWLFFWPKPMNIPVSFSSYYTDSSPTPTQRYVSGTMQTTLGLFDNGIETVYVLDGLDQREYVWCVRGDDPTGFAATSKAYLASPKEQTEEPVRIMEATEIIFCTEFGDAGQLVNFLTEIPNRQVALEVQDSLKQPLPVETLAGQAPAVSDTFIRYIQLQLNPEGDLRWQAEISAREDGSVFLILSERFHAPEGKGPFYCDVTEVLGPYWDEIVYGTES